MNKQIKQKKIIKNLGLCGGGFFGYAHVGALKKLEDYKSHIDIQNVRGSSVGSMIAALYAIGYSVDDLTNILFDMDFDKLIKDSSMPYINFYGKFGMYQAEKLEEEIERLIREKTHIKFCTFSQVKKNLTIIATNLNYQCPYFFNKENTPDMLVSKAIRMSISYPGYITPVLYNGDLYGDGGESINYPITTFDNLDETIGITFSAHNENTDGTLRDRIPIDNIYDYIRSFAMTLSRTAYVSQVKQKHLDRSIIVHIAENISSMQFNLTLEQKKYIFECGKKAVEEQISKIIS